MIDLCLHQNYDSNLLNEIYVEIQSSTANLATVAQLKSALKRHISISRWKLLVSPVLFMKICTVF